MWNCISMHLARTSGQAPFILGKMSEWGAAQVLMDTEFSLTLGDVGRKPFSQPVPVSM